MKWKLWLNAVTFIALGIIILLAWHDIVRALSRITELNIWIILLMIPAQFLVYITLAKFFHFFFKAAGVNLSAKQLFAPMLELNFVNHILPSGGVSGFSYLTLRLKQFDVSTAKSTLAQIARFAFTFVCFIALMLVALLLLALEGRTSSLVVLTVSALTFTILFGTGVLLFVIGSETRIAAFTGSLTRMLNRVIHVFRRRHPETISLKNVETTFLELHEDYKLLRGHMGRLRQVLLWGMLVNIAELLLLYLVFVAHGVWVNPGAVIIAFVIANIAGLIAVLPGGVGVYEPLMAGVLISGGVPGTLAVSATLVYRVVALLISLLSGYLLYNRAIHRHGTADLSSQRTN